MAEKLTEKFVDEGGQATGGLVRSLLERVGCNRQPQTRIHPQPSQRLELPSLVVVLDEGERKVG
jgi:hypothetical protein